MGDKGVSVEKETQLIAHCSHLECASSIYDRSCSMHYSFHPLKFFWTEAGIVLVFYSFIHILIMKIKQIGIK